MQEPQPLASSVFASEGAVSKHERVSRLRADDAGLDSQPCLWFKSCVRLENHQHQLGFELVAYPHLRPYGGP